jgi:rubrerythrin
MTKFTTTPRPGPQARRRAPGNAIATTGGGGTLDFTLACEVCGAPFRPRKPWGRFCCPTCRARAHDAKTGRTSHAPST